MKTIIGTRYGRYAQPRPWEPQIIIEAGKEYSDLSEHMMDRIVELGGAKLVNSGVDGAEDSSVEESEIEEIEEESIKEEIEVSQLQMEQSIIKPESKETRKSKKKKNR